MLRTFATAAVLVAFAVFTHWKNRRFDGIRGPLGSGQKSLRVIQAFRSLNLHPPSSSLILLKPEMRFYQDGYYPAFVASLVWNDRSLHIYVAGQHQPTQPQIAAISYVISFDEFEAKLVASQNPITFCVMHETLASSWVKIAPRFWTARGGFCAHSRVDVSGIQNLILTRYRLKV